ncbi:MAG TPA: methyltransferase [Ktedonobacteraceae bacterium]|nr:methyltransferase [Ktedonobacteraceae bacterium]
MINGVTLPPLLSPPCDDHLISEVWGSRFYLPTLLLADEIGLFTFLATTPANAERLAAEFSLGQNGIEIVLDLLSALGFLERQQDGFHLSETTQHYMLPESPYYCGNILRGMNTQPFTAAGLKDLLVKEQESDPELQQGWKVEEMSAAITERVTAAVHAHALPSALGVAQKGDFTGVRRLLDIAGGSGCYCMALSLHYADMHFTVLELPSVSRVVARYIAAYGLEDRIDTVAVDMFTDSWPSGYDGIFFSDVFHNWQRANCLYLAQRSFAALPPGGRLFVHEMLLNETRNAPLTVVAHSMHMHNFLGGRQYTMGELEDLLHEAGFVNISVTPTFSSYSLVTASKPV